jgi:demethylmenaquinone methyltransferase / 2-methoxy-6-polyprenyl-1,4-benzoquinol methylase
MDTQKSTHFGFQSVDWNEKTAKVRGVFDSVASKYDLMNDVMSLGLHRLWKRDFVSSLQLKDGQRVLDLAGGTGDIAFLMSRMANLDITVCDINAAMLAQGRDRAIDKNITDLLWNCGNAETLPFADRSYDRCTIAFGIRNVTDIPAALKEILRVLKPGGRFACLEFSTLTLPMMKPIYDQYSFKAIPQFGQWLTGDRDSYQYLVESIRRFPDQARFAEMIKDAGFSQVKWRNLSGGVVAIHSGWRV